ncbi:hypothetical protein RB195_010240 [Necator americanus]|uniref:Uncharacterized protein n=1 Tax=Necator americanus TaxID=51031 RepID=A0ABR1CY66_NECAM
MGGASRDLTTLLATTFHRSSKEAAYATAPPDFAFILSVQSHSKEVCATFSEVLFRAKRAPLRSITNVFQRTRMHDGKKRECPVIPECLAGYMRQ